MNANNTGLGLLGGIGLGAALMYFLDPDRGRRRRGLVRDQVVSAVSKADDAVGATARDLGNRARGLASEARSRFKQDEASDEVLVARVRAELGRAVSHPSAIEVTAEQGRVTLSGPILAREVDDVLSTVRSVRGVADVENQLEVHERPDNIPALQGGSERRGGEFELMQENWSPAARLLVGTAGAALALYGSRRQDAIGAALGLAGLTLFARSATNTELRRLTGVGDGRRAVDIQKTINLNVPVEQVFTFFTDYENWPRFMSHVREVRYLGGGRTHWVVDGPAGTTIEWDAEITQLLENELLSWKSVEGAAVEHAGTLRFEPTADGGTRVDIKMSYNPPAGAAGHAIAVLFRADPKKQMDDDLARLKTTIETGIPPRDAAQPGGVEQLPVT
jgi:uncharacterized membrane protein